MKTDEGQGYRGGGTEIPIVISLRALLDLPIHLTLKLGNIGRTCVAKYSFRMF